MPQPTLTSTFIEKVPRTPGTASYRFARPPGYAFTPGQWFVLTIPAPAGPLTKHFTHSSSPTEGYLEFTTRLTGSDYKLAVDALQPGAEVQIEGPYGAFTLRPDTERVAFLTGGIGITPGRSILRYLSACGLLPRLPGLDRLTGSAGGGADVALGDPIASPKEIALLYGNQDERSITFGDELAILAGPRSPLRLVNVLSAPTDAWEGYRGYVRREIVERELPQPEQWIYYVSGPPAMVEAMRVMLVEIGITRRQMVLENFEGYE